MERNQNQPRPGGVFWMYVWGDCFGCCVFEVLSGEGDEHMPISSHTSSSKTLVFIFPSIASLSGSAVAHLNHR
ncbi:hypothetical protein [Candidatus Nitrotoga sp. BS]|uniref:hypothetical protein n=1 Tax=Candidatus Nitrotoga sp. BS TaxID=2890408 RepID=UPI001EF2CBAA|nr:hypothetical protein [Candidatus Nitrotoga sp. BS]